jgi:hypothetical protein
VTTAPPATLRIPFFPVMILLRDAVITGLFQNMDDSFPGFESENRSRRTRTSFLFCHACRHTGKRGDPSVKKYEKMVVALRIGLFGITTQIQFKKAVVPACFY